MAKKVLFVCIQNSARSQIAEAILKKYGEDLFEVESAGIEPGTLNPLVIEVLKKEEDIDISGNSTDSVFDFFKNGKKYNYVITVCDESSAEKCPIFQGLRCKIHMSFEDPAELKGDEITKYLSTKKIYDQIKNEILKFIELIKKDTLEKDKPKNWFITN